MKLAVVGATGMIGNHTARAVVARGHTLVVLHRARSRLDALADLRFEAVEADLDDPPSLRRALVGRGIEGVIHCAAYYPTVPRPWRAEVETATRQMEAFYDVCRGQGFHRVVYLGGAIAIPRARGARGGTGPADESASYPGEPPDRTPYVRVKAALDAMARQLAGRDLPVVIGIPSMCFGEYDKGPTTGRLIVEIANGTLPAYVRGDRNVVYTGDAGTGLVLACEKGRVGERYLFTGANLTMDELVALIARVAGVAAPRRVLPLPLARLVSRLQEVRWRLVKGEPPRLSATAVAVMASGQFLDGRKAEHELGYRPSVDTAEAIRRALDWFRAQGYVLPQA